MARPTGAIADPAAMFTNEIRELIFTRDRFWGVTRGMTALRATPNARDSMSRPSARG